MKNHHSDSTTAQGLQTFIFDDIPPEAVAMLQALYSRDPKSVIEHLKRVKEVGPEKFMGSYYVGYGHKSIGDCGTTTLFAEQVSLLAAKAIQDWPLYNGQEASTRYLNMSEQEVLNPLGTAEGKTIQNEWMRLYRETLDELVPFLKKKFPRTQDQEERVYDKAILAKAFDIARGFLPAGVTTLVSWHTNLRQAYDHIQRLHHHPLPEVRKVADILHSDLKGKYANSFSHKHYAEQENYIAASENEFAYFDDPKIKKFKGVSRLDIKGLSRYKKLLATRPQKTELSHYFRKFGDLRYTFLLDFGSFRDLQRHRSGIIMMPLLGIDHGFTPWYLEQLPSATLKKVVKGIKEQEKRIRKLKCSPEMRQYYVAIGYAVTCEVTMSLPATIYTAELRSSQMVHATLRVIAQKMAAHVKKTLPWIAMHHDDSGDAWDIKRGKQDIVKR